MTHCLIASTSTIHGSSYLEYLKEPLEVLFKGVDEVLFIPYAKPGGIDYDAYCGLVQEAFKTLGKRIVGIHTFTDPIAAVNNAKGIFTGGGNTFALVTQLYRHHLLASLKKAILNGIPYLGTSAGSNIMGPSMKTSNDMPIVYPPSFKTLGILPFNINPHYIDPDPTSTHKGETRETRIKEFHEYNRQPVVGLREGSWIWVEGDTLLLQGGNLSARIFEPGKQPYEVEPGTNLNTLK